MSSYRIEHLVGSGGMGWVYRATHVLERRIVALKVLRADQLRHDRAIERTMREASILAALSYPGIPRFFECGIIGDGRPWIAMELVEGVSLAKRLNRQAIPAADVIELLAEIAGILASAHVKQVTHRDLKPDNIILCETGQAPVVVIDWGIARHELGGRITNMNEAIGTPTYMAPEQARGVSATGPCDVYALGIVAYEALTGQPPFAGATAVETLIQHLNRPLPPLGPRCQDAPTGLVQLVQDMLAKDSDHRPTASEVRERALIIRATSDDYESFSLARDVEAVVVPAIKRERITTPLVAQKRHGSLPRS